MSKLDEWDEINGEEGELWEPDLNDNSDEEVASKPVAVIAPSKMQVVKTQESQVPIVEALPQSYELPQEQEVIAQLMVREKGNLAKVSRDPAVDYNAMSLRAFVKNHPEIRKRYHELLAEELMDRGLHVAERILQMSDLKDAAMGQTVVVDGPNGPEEMDLPADPKMVIELSKEISRLMAEGKQQNMSAKNTVLLASKEDAEELLAAFLNS